MVPDSFESVPLDDVGTDITYASIDEGEVRVPQRGNPRGFGRWVMVGTTLATKYVVLMEMATGKWCTPNTFWVTLTR